MSGDIQPPPPPPEDCEKDKCDVDCPPVCEPPGPPPITPLVYIGDENTNGVVGTILNDRIFTFGGNDNIAGLGGNDTIKGGAGDDRILAGAGNDAVSGDTGRDIIFSGAGDDRLVFNRFSDRDRVTDFDDFGNDVLDVRALNIDFADVNLTQVGGNVVVTFDGFPPGPLTGPTILLGGTALASVGADDFSF